MELARAVTRQVVTELNQRRGLGSFPNIDIENRGQIVAGLSLDRGTANPAQMAPEAEEAYLRGRYQLSLDTLEGCQLALGYFQKTIAQEPDNPLGYVGVADAESRLVYLFGAPLTKFFPLAGAAAGKALQLDDSSAEAHSLLALARVYLDRDWDGADKEFRRALLLSPGDGSLCI